MGMFSGLSEKLFGGNNNSQQKTSERQSEYSRRYTQQQVGQGRSDINNLYDRGDYARNYGYNQALDVVGRSMPTQANYYQGGNVAAQQAILGGQPQIYQAPQMNPQAFQYQMPMYEPMAFDYVPMLTKSIGWSNKVPRNVMGNNPMAGNPYDAPPVEGVPYKPKTDGVSLPGWIKGLHYAHGDYPAIAVTKDYDVYS